MIVIDASLAAAWLLHETDAVPTDELLTVLTTEPIIVPAHWPTELGNALRKAVRAGRLPASEAALLIDRLSLLDIATMPPIPMKEIGMLVDFALEQRLSVYDAGYLHLAAARRLPLATLDRDMRAAASRLNVALLPA